MKSVLISIKPYYVFLIIAHKMGWDIPQEEKTIEVRKDYPKDKEWNKVVHIYCSKDKKSFNLIPAQYQPLMGEFIGRVIGEFMCDNIYDIKPHCDIGDYVNQYECCWKYGEDFHCLSFSEMKSYLKNKKGYGWHISNLKIYDKPKSIMQFYKPCPDKFHCCEICKYGSVVLSPDEEEYALYHGGNYDTYETVCRNIVTRPPQSYMYVEEV